MVMGLYGLAAVAIDRSPYAYLTKYTQLPASLEAALTLAIGMVLLFRVNRAYERWWEARTLWGNLVNVSRNLAVKVRELVGVDRDEAADVRELIVAFAVGLKSHLRDEDMPQPLPGLDEEIQTPAHVPSHLVGQLYRRIATWRDAQRITGYDQWVLDQEARQLLDVCGGCERIKLTLMSQSWQAFVRQCLLLYLLMLPWGLLNTYGAWTIPFSILVGYVVMAAEGIAHYVEEPFGHFEDHLDLDAICTAIDTSVSEILRS